MANSTTKFTVRGIDSEDEIAKITDELEELHGVQLVEIDEKTGDARVRYGDDLLSEEKIRSAVRDLGYEVE